MRLWRDLETQIGVVAGLGVNTGVKEEWDLLQVRIRAVLGAFYGGEKTGVRRFAGWVDWP